MAWGPFRPSTTCRPRLRAACFGAATVLVSCQPFASDEAQKAAEQEHALRTVPVQTIVDGSFEYTERGEVVNALVAGKLDRWEEGPRNDGQWTVSEGFTLFIGGAQGNHHATLSATRGTYDDQHGHLEAWDDVVLVNEEGDRLLTEHLVWLHDSDLVRTERPVEIFTDQGVLRGTGLRADSQFETYQILRPTGSFELSLDDQKPSPHE